MLSWQSAEFRGFLEVAAVLAKDYSVLKEGEGATKGASAALPPAPWHIEIFAQARHSFSGIQGRVWRCFQYCKLSRTEAF